MNKTVVAISASGKYELSFYRGVNIHTGEYETWSICGTEIINEWGGVNSYHHGLKKYIQKVWNRIYSEK